MSEEQNLLFEAAAPPPQRVKDREKPAKPASSGTKRPRKSALAKAGTSAAEEGAPRRSDSQTAGDAASNPGPAATVPQPSAPASAPPVAAPTSAPVAAEQQGSNGSESAQRNGQDRSSRGRSEAHAPRNGSNAGTDGGGPYGSERNDTKGSGGEHEDSAPKDSRERDDSGGEGPSGGEPRDHHARPVGVDGDRAAGDAGGSKSRRRRRKRKNRAVANAGGTTAQQDGGNAGVIEASGDAAEPPVRELRQNNGQHGNGVVGQGFSSGQNASGSVVGQGFSSGQNGGGQTFSQNGQNLRRNKKKKFRRAGEGESGGQSNFQNNGPRPPRPEPGNSLQGSTSGMGQRRNRKQQQGGGSGGQNRGPRQFVGPMDHSYREVNGNFADGPASTVQMNNARHRSNGHRQFNEDRLPPELMHHSRPVTIPIDAPTHIYFFIEDLFFTAKIQEAAKQQGVKVAFMKPDKDVVAHLSELHDHEHPSLIVFDLNNVNAKPLTLIPKLKAKLKKGTSILGFLSHLQGDLKQKAVEAGCHTVMPRSAFSQNLPNLLRRYGVEDEHEPNYNQ